MSVNKNRPPAVIRLVSDTDGWHPGSKVLDLGCGKYPDTTEESLKKFRVKYAGVDPYNRTTEENAKAIKYIGKADVVIISNVLNVIRCRSDRIDLLGKAKSSMKPNGRIYVTVYERDKSGVGCVTSQYYQANRITDDYVQEILEVFKRVTRRGKLLTATT